ncbi:MAG: polysaccharide biosynthesis protein [Heliobacteriaceae bacterium]|nr:polysaccharide biosynthesis protein [Heliobacteriaceae bacterium]MDD4586789.1 polysaccharide biosynthesis protein [Heliobacteriaceae bacterium]
MPTALVYGTLVLFSATLINRLLGFFNQVVLMKYIGPETVGLVQMVYPVYLLLLVTATAGFPVAVTKRIAEEAAFNHWGNIRRILQVAALVLLPLGLLITCIAIFLPHLIFSHLIVDNRAVAAFWALVPSILIVGLSSLMRAFCQGMQAMEPPALSALIEQLIRIMAGLALAFFLLPHGPTWAATGIAAGISLGEFFGLASILMLGGPYFFQRLKHFWYGRKQPASLSCRQAFHLLWPLAYPVAISRILTGLMITLDASLIPRCLQASGLSLAEATKTFGSFNGGIAPLLSIPTVVTIPLATGMLAGISESWALGQVSTVRYRTLKALKITAFVGWPLIGLLLLLGEEAMTLLFNLSGFGACLHILAIGAIFQYLHQTTTGILQGLGRVVFPLVVTIFAGTTRALVYFHLASSPSWGVIGVAVAYSLSNALTAFCHLAFLRGHLTLAWRDYLAVFLPGAALLPMAGGFIIAGLIADFPATGWAVIVYSCCALGAYLLSLPFLGCISRDDLRIFTGNVWFSRLIGWKNFFR